MVIDTSTVACALRALSGKRGFFNFESLTSLMQFVETLVLHERLYIDEGTYRLNEFGEMFSECGLGDIVLGIKSDSHFGDQIDQYMLNSLNEGFLARLCTARDIEEMLPGVTGITDIMNSEPINSVLSEIDDLEHSLEGTLDYDDGGGMGLWVRKNIYSLAISNMVSLPYIPHPPRASFLKAHLAEIHQQSNQTEDYAAISTKNLSDLAEAQIDVFLTKRK